MKTALEKVKAIADEYKIKQGEDFAVVGKCGGFDVVLLETALGKKRSIHYRTDEN